VEKTKDLLDVAYRLFSGMSAEIAGKSNQLAEYGTGDRPLARATVLRLLKKAGYAKRPTTEKPILKSVHYAAWLKWAREHKYWSIEDWDRVIWSDESG
jgi:hypothetical protein